MNRLTRLFATAATAVLVLFGRACAWVIDSQPGNRITFVAAPTAWPSASSDSLVVVRDDGSELVVERAYIAWSRLVATPCSPLATASNQRSHFVASARAHDLADPLRVDLSLTESLLDRATRPLAALDLPDGTYCRLTLGASGSDRHSVAPDLDLERSTLFVEGFFRPSPTAAWTAFALRDTAAFDVVLDLAADDGELSDGRTLVVTVTKDASTWFEGLTFATSDSRDDSRRLLDNLSRSLAAHIERPE